MPQIIPVILAKDLNEFTHKLNLLRPLQTLIQVDVVDGKFAPYLTFSDPEIIKQIAMPPFELDLMVERPLKQVGAWAKAGVEVFIFHLESKDDPWLVIKEVKKYHLKVGMSLNPDTPWQALEPYLGQIDCVLFLGVHPGKSGQEFIPEVLEKIKEFHQKYPKMPFEIDGGVTEDNVEVLAKTGATRLAASSAILKSDNPKEAFKKLSEMASAGGILGSSIPKN